MTFLLFAWDWPFVLGLLTVFVVNLVLSGDNGVVIALAAKSLARALRLRAITVGAACAVLLRVAATFYATPLLNIEFLRLTGGVVILWIAVSLFNEAEPGAKHTKHPAGFWKAIWLIIAADLTMSTDNIIAIAAVAQGNFLLLLIGLGLSIPFVVFASTLIANLMDKHPVVVYLGAGILGKVGAEMIISDPFAVRVLHPSSALRYGVETVGALGVLAVGQFLMSRRREEVREPAERDRGL